MSNYKVFKTTEGFEDEYHAIHHNIYAVLLRINAEYGEYLCIDIVNDEGYINHSTHVIGTL